MYLRKLSSEPRGLLHLYNGQDEVNFVEGINFIFGKKTLPDASLNSIGKSCLLDLIDFCLLHPPLRKNTRLHKAKEAEVFDGYKVVLEFEVENKVYVIKRSFSHNRIEFGEISDISEYSISEITPILHKLIFDNPQYKGEQPAEWFRNLLEFYLKIQRRNTDKFGDPIRYSQWKSLSELNQYHLFFLGINNMLACDNFTVQEELKNKNKLIKEVEIVRDTYELKIPEVNTRISRLEREIKGLQNAVEVFQLAEHYKDTEERANQLTSQIKELWYQNYLERKRLEAYRESYQTNGSSISTRRISNLYKETNELLAQSIKATLDEAIQFRQQLAQSRRDFLTREIGILEQAINRRSIQIETLEQERSTLFRFLSETQAISDLTNVFYEIGQKQKLLSELEGQIRLYRDLTKQKAALQTDESRIVEEYIDFVEAIRQPISNFYEVFSQVYKSIFPGSKDDPSFGVDINSKTAAKLEIEISFEGDAGQGRNHSRTLVYDLGVLLHSIEKGLIGPKVLIHDGIFNGMDKSHFVVLYEFLTQQSDALKMRDKKFQYIVTINEEGTLSEKFGHADKVTPEKIEQEAVAILSPDSKLFGVSF